jgi:branched-chain amino acid transport system permease protein
VRVDYWSRVGWRALVAAVVLAVLLSIPSWVDDRYLVHLLAVSAAMAIGAMSLNLLAGVAGQISLAHAAFLGVGGYATAILTTRHGWGYWTSVLAAIGMGALAGVLLGAPALRLRGHYLGMVTLGAGQIFTIVAATAVSLTGGANGIAGIPAPNVGSRSLVDDSDLLRLLAVIAALVYVVLTALTEGQLGRGMAAVRQDEVAAASVCLVTGRYKLLAFAVSSALASLAGALLVGLNGVASPESFGISQSILFLVMVVIGGLRSYGGAAAGAAAVTLLPEYLRGLDAWYMFAFGAVIVLVAVVAPGGLASVVRRLDAVVSLLRPSRTRVDRTRA